jgi:fibronectin-binding autotransporter adhesin
LALGLLADTSFAFPVTLSVSVSSQYLGALHVSGSVNVCAGGGASSTPLTATLSGDVTLNSDIKYSGDYLTNVTGTYTANGHSVTSLAGSTGTFTADGHTTEVTLTKRTIAAGDSDATQQEYVVGGEELTLDGTRGDVEVAAGAVLKGTGTTGELTVDENGTVAPGHSPGCLTVNGGLNEYGTYEAEVGGSDPCTGYDQLKVTGAVDLGGSNNNPQGKLNVLLYNGFEPEAGQTYTLIDNDGTDAVTGTFAGMDEGATFTVAGFVFTISYTGGDGNDVVVSVENVPETPDTGFARITSNPLTTLIATTLAAGGILLIAKRPRFSKATVRSRR